MKVLFIEPPKDLFFVMGQYLPPPYGIIQLAAYLERELKDVQVEILDCNAEKVDWTAMESRIRTSCPDIVASASLATCNTYAVAKTLEIAKKVNPNILTVTGGQHFTATAQDSLELYPEIDVIVRGEGERILLELAENWNARKCFPKIRGLSHRQAGKIVHNPPRSLIENLEELPFPGYHLVRHLMHRYHFSSMAGSNAPYALIEGSRGCSHQCSFCTQWRHWQGRWRLKSAKRIADEMNYCYSNFGSKFIWLTDDNFGAGTRPKEIAEEIIKRRMPEDVSWFVQARCDDIIRNKDTLPILRKSGLNWVLLGVENSNPATLDKYGKDITPEDARTAIKLLKDNNIFAHAMVIIGQRKDTRESIAELRKFVDELDPDLVMFSCLVPFPGTEIYKEAQQNGWIEDKNWSHYDMIYAIMSTETLSIKELQEELYLCYRTFYGSWPRRMKSLFSKNKLRRSVYWHMAGSNVLGRVKSML